MNQIEFLRGVSLFSALSDEELNKISNQTETVEFVRDAFICKEGQKADSMFIIKSGIVQIFCDDSKSGRKILTHLKRGEYFGEMSLLTEDPRTASAVALAETEVVRLRKDDFYDLLKKSPVVSLSIIRTLCERLSKANIGMPQINKHNVYAVLGPDTGSGKSLFARNLAYAMKELLGKQVLLYDPNLRDEKVAKFLGVTQRSKIIDELIDKERIAEPQKYVVEAPCGLQTILPQENGLTDLRLKEFHTFSIMKTIMETYEFILVDSSSMFTKVTKEIVQSCDKIIYLISSRNVSISGLIDHFEETRRSWKVDPSKVIYGVNHTTDDPKKKSIITEKDRQVIKFEIPFDKSLENRREPDQKLIIQTNPEHPLSSICRRQADAMMFDQQLGLVLPSFSDSPDKADLARRWFESGVQELGQTLLHVQASGPAERNGRLQYVISGQTAQWLLNQQVVKVVAFANKFKQEFGIDKVTLLLNNQESVV